MTAIERVLRRLTAVVDGAAAIFLAVITLLTFVSVVLRYAFNYPLPDGFDIGRLLLGVAIFWGIAGAAFRNEHIQVDVLYAALPTTPRRAIDLFATLLFFLFASALAWMTLRQVLSVQRSGQTTIDLQIPIWPFYGVAWLGLALCAALLGLRFILLILPRSRS